MQVRHCDGRDRHVLVVDDNVALRHVLGRLLQAHRFTALEAGSMAEAIASAERHHLCAIILDLNLGTQSGVDVLEWLRRAPRYAAVPILILTGRTLLGGDDVARMQRHHAHVFYKPQPLSRIVEYLACLVDASDMDDAVLFDGHTRVLTSSSGSCRFQDEHLRS